MFFLIMKKICPIKAPSNVVIIIKTSGRNMSKTNPEETNGPMIGVNNIIKKNEITNGPKKIDCIILLPQSPT